MEANTSAIVSAYSGGQLYDDWSRKANEGLSITEAALIRTYCTNTNVAVLNLGCGAGRESFAMYALSFRNIKGIDCTPALLDVARHKAQEFKMPIDFVQGWADALPFSADSFDVITAFSNVYGHITPRAKRIKTLTEIRRVLRGGGLFILSAQSLHDRWRYFLYIKALEIVRSFHNPANMEKGDKPIRLGPIDGSARSHWFAPHEICDEAAHAGLEVALETTTKMVNNNTFCNAIHFHKQGYLAYVLRKKS